MGQLLGRAAGDMLESRRAGLIDRSLPEDFRRLVFLGPLRVPAGSGALVEM